MKLTVDRTALAKALATLNRVVAKRTTIPILSNVMIQAGRPSHSSSSAVRDECANHMIITATDLDMEARASIPAEVETPGGVTLPAATLHGIVSKLPANAHIILEMPSGDDGAKSNERMVLRAGRSRFVLPTRPTSDFPEFPTGDLIHRFTLPGKVLAQIINNTAFAIAQDEARYYLNGIYLHPVNIDRERMVLRAVATDGHRLASFEVDLPAGAEAMPGVIVPQKAVGEFDRLARAAEGDVAIALSDSKIQLSVFSDPSRTALDDGSAGDIVLTSKLIDGTFPDYVRVIPSGNDKHATIDRAALREAVARCATVASERGRAIKLAFDGETLTLSVNNPDAGDAREEIEIDFPADPIEIGFNSGYLEDILGVIDSDRVRVKLADPGSAGLFQPITANTTDERILLVLMPMRV